METINRSYAKIHLSRLVNRAAKGDGFVIAKAGKPLVKVVPLNAPPQSKPRRLGFLSGQVVVPANFEDLGRDEIEQAFGETE